MEEKTRKVTAYAGAERRRGQRRIGNGDRRKDVRWEPGKVIRRLGEGRRKTDAAWDRRDRV